MTFIQCQYKRNCCYRKSECYTVSYKEEFQFTCKEPSRFINDRFLVSTKSERIKATITAGFTNNGFHINENILKIEGPSLSSEWTITGLKMANYDRCFGYIQFSKIFFETNYEGFIKRVDFHENLLHNQDVVLDSDGQNNPFYSCKSYVKVQAGHNPPNEITLSIYDCPSCSELLYFHGGYLLNLEKHQQFYVYLVMTYWDNGELKYDPLHRFDWFIYLHWREKNYIYDFGINPHQTVRDFPLINKFQKLNEDEFYEWIYNLVQDGEAVIDNFSGNGPFYQVPDPEIPRGETKFTSFDCPNSETTLNFNFGSLQNEESFQEFRTCNKDQFTHCIDLLNNQFHIVDYPDLVCNREIFYQNIKNAVIDTN